MHTLTLESSLPKYSSGPDEVGYKHPCLYLQYKALANFLGLHNISLALICAILRLIIDPPLFHQRPLFPACILYLQSGKVSNAHTAWEGSKMTRPSKIRLACILACVFFLLACSQKRPVLYPTAHLEQVGNEVAQADIDECMRLADEYDASSSSSGKVAKGTAKGAAVGGAGGAATGAVLGSVGRGAAAGAAGGAAIGLTRGLFRSREPDPVFKRFVDKCLRERGYEPIGWK